MIFLHEIIYVIRYTVKSQIESATLFKIRHFWRDSNRVRTLFEWGLYFFCVIGEKFECQEIIKFPLYMPLNKAIHIIFTYLGIYSLDFKVDEAF